MLFGSLVNRLQISLRGSGDSQEEGREGLLSSPMGKGARWVDGVGYFVVQESDFLYDETRLFLKGKI